MKQKILAEIERLQVIYSDDSKEAAEEYTKDDTLKPWRNLCKEAFTAGAKWQLNKIRKKYEKNRD